MLVIPSESDVSPVVKRHFRLFEQVFEAIELAILCSGYHEEDLYCEGCKSMRGVKGVRV